MASGVATVPIALIGAVVSLAVGLAVLLGSATGRGRQTTLGGAWWWTIAALVGLGGGELTVRLLSRTGCQLACAAAGLLPSPSAFARSSRCWGQAAAASGVELCRALAVGIVALRRRSVLFGTRASGWRWETLAAGSYGF